MGATTRHLHLVVPRLAENPVIAGGPCCAVHADEAIVVRLRRWTGVRSISVDLERARVDVELAREGATLADVVDELTGLGFPVAQMSVTET